MTFHHVPETLYCALVFVNQIFHTQSKGEVRIQAICQAHYIAQQYTLMYVNATWTFSA